MAEGVAQLILKLPGGASRESMKQDDQLMADTRPLQGNKLQALLGPLLSRQGGIVPRRRCLVLSSTLSISLIPSASTFELHFCRYSGQAGEPCDGMGMQVEELHDRHTKLQKLHADWRAQEGRVQRMNTEVEALAQQVGADTMKVGRTTNVLAKRLLKYYRVC